MAAKREQVIWDNLWVITERLENKYSLKALCSAGMLVLHEMDAEQRETAIERAFLYPETAPEIVAAAEARQVKMKRTKVRRKPKAS